MTNGIDILEALYDQIAQLPLWGQCLVVFALAYFVGRPLWSIGRFTWNAGKVAVSPLVWAYRAPKRFAEWREQRAADREVRSAVNSEAVYMNGTGLPPMDAMTIPRLLQVAQLIVDTRGECLVDWIERKGTRQVFQQPNRIDLLRDRLRSLMDGSILSKSEKALVQKACDVARTYWSLSKTLDEGLDPAVPDEDVVVHSVTINGETYLSMEAAQKATQNQFDAERVRKASADFMRQIHEGGIAKPGTPVDRDFQKVVREQLAKMAIPPRKPSLKSILERAKENARQDQES